MQPAGCPIFHVSETHYGWCQSLGRWWFDKRNQEKAVETLNVWLFLHRCLHGAFKPTQRTGPTELKAVQCYSICMVVVVYSQSRPRREIRQSGVLVSQEGSGSAVAKGGNASCKNEDRLLNAKKVFKTKVLCSRGRCARLASAMELVHFSKFAFK